MNWLVAAARAVLRPFGYKVLKMRGDARRGIEHVDAVAYQAGSQAIRSRKATNAGATHHVLITGTGRAGTSFLVQLLTRLGLPTGFDEESLNLFMPARAGLEYRLGRGRNEPYIVKHPNIGLDLPKLLDEGRVVIDHAFIPVRHLDAVVASSRHVHQISGEGFGIEGGSAIDGDEDQQRSFLAADFHETIATLADHDVPMEFLAFPRITRDPDYLYRRLGPLVAGIPFPTFSKVFSETVRPGWVNDF